MASRDQRRLLAPRRSSWLAVLLVAALAVVVLAVAARSADAVILPAMTLDGPSEDIVGFGGVAMAEDGTGGAVYLSASRAWPTCSSRATAKGIGSRRSGWTPNSLSRRAGRASVRPNGGELLVVWATPFATESGHPVDELLSATLGPGAASFGPSMIVDPDIREAAPARARTLAMSSTGQADVVYRVVKSEDGQRSSIPLLRPGDVVEDVRVAHFGGETLVESRHDQS